MSHRWTSFRNQITRAAGLSPAVVALAIAGCDAEPPVEPLAPLAVLPRAQLAPPLTLASPAAFETGRFLDFAVSGAPPNSRVWLVGGSTPGVGPCPPILGGQCIGLDDARILTSARSDGAGNVTLTAELPYTLPDGLDVAVQAVSTGSLSPVQTGLTSHAPRTCAEVPVLTRRTMWTEDQVIACGPLPASGTCPAVGSLSYSDMSWIFEYATGRDPNRGVTGWDVDLQCDETSIETACCYEGFLWQWVVGRPYTVDGSARLAETTGRADWQTEVDLDVGQLPRRVRRHLGRAWTTTAQGEHASVASFSRFVLHLTRLGAPADLVAEATNAMSDEIRHARDAFAIASALAEEPLGPGPLPLPAEVAMRPEDIVVSAVREGCIAETIAAAQAAAARDACTEPRIREVLDRVAEDEARHAALAWRFVRWVLQAHPDLHEAVAAAFAEPPPVPRVDPSALDGVETAWGVLPEADKRRVAAEVMRQVITPCATAMLHGEVAEPVIAQA